MQVQKIKYFFSLLPVNYQNKIRNFVNRRKDKSKIKALASVGAVKIENPDINNLLHHLRGEALRGLPHGAENFVSVGCAGTWYFKWLEETCGPIKQHVGVEFYMSKPTDLPKNVDWIVNTAGNMPEIKSNSADILFSGQNIEHLWPEEIVGFLFESHRILKKDGLLVIDSPNNKITEKLGWSHPEHTIEFSIEEITELLNLVGFEIKRKHGIWLSEDPLTGNLLPFEELSLEGKFPIGERVRIANKNIDNSFIWWIEATKKNEIGDKAVVKNKLNKIFNSTWPNRVNRLKTTIGKIVNKNGEVWFDSLGRSGALMFGPYLPLQAGKYDVKFKAKLNQKYNLSENNIILSFDVMAGDGTVISKKDIKFKDVKVDEEFHVVVPFEISKTTFGIQFRTLSMQAIRCEVAKSIQLTPHSEMKVETDRNAHL